MVGENVCGELGMGSRQNGDVVARLMTLSLIANGAERFLGAYNVAETTGVNPGEVGMVVVPARVVVNVVMVCVLVVNTVPE